MPVSFPYLFLIDFRNPGNLICSESKALQVLNQDGAKLGIPKDIKESAALIYRKAVEKKLIRGRSIESIVCAAIYASCRMINIPRTLDEISRVSEVNKK